MTGCGDATFGGNYQEATAEDVQTFANEAALAGGSNDIDLALGYQLIAKMSFGEGAQAYNMDMDIKFSADNDDGILLTATMKGKVSGQNVNATMYWADGYAYVNTEGLKVKERMEDMGDIYGDLVSAVEGFDLSALAQMAIEDTTIKLGMVREDNGTTKIKFDMPENSVLVGTIVFVFDAEYDLSAMKFDVTMQGMKLEITYKPWNGTVNLPGDLNTYVG